MGELTVAIKQAKQIDTQNVMSPDRGHPNSTLRRSIVPCLPFSCWPSRTKGGRACRAVWDVPRDLSLAYTKCAERRGEKPKGVEGGGGFRHRE